MSESKHEENRLSLTKRALLEIIDLKARVRELESASREPIAVVAVGCRFPPGAHDPEAFWRLLEGGVDAVTEVPAGRWDVEAYYAPAPDAPGKMYARHGAFLDGVELFDAQFFGISP